VQGDTYNYYTYNYYYDDNDTVQRSAYSVERIGYPLNAERSTLSSQQAVEPGQPTVADQYFEDAVKAFEAGDYIAAAEKFACAMEYAPDDMVLPFAYAQALLANEQYTEAADVLRSALERVSPEKEGVFYPRGLYADDDVLAQQIDRLAEKAKLYSYDADLQLLWGYQLLGIGEVEKSLEPLCRAMLDLENAKAAKMLLDLAEKIEAANPA
jgi:thioredoxin-like negative regulator of GroEL